KKRSQAVLVVTMLAAIIPTILSAQGMVMVGIDALGLSALMAVALAGFCELALVASALSARDAIARGRSARVDLIATWILSLVSGGLSALHELINPTILTASGILAAAVRIVAPLVACWLWHRVVSADAEESVDLTLRERKRHNAILDIAVTAQAAAEAVGTPRYDRTRAEMRTAYLKMRRHYPEVPQATVMVMAEEIASADALTTLFTGHQTPTADTTPTHPEKEAPLPSAVDTPSPATEKTTPLQDSFVELEMSAADKPTGSDNADGVRIAAQLLTVYGHATTGRHVQEAMSELGHSVSDRTARRYLAAAKENADMSAMTGQLLAAS
ncbi:hypothetical protein GZ176_11625, partial [Dermatophilus congolensis]